MVEMLKSVGRSLLEGDLDLIAGDLGEIVLGHFAEIEANGFHGVSKAVETNGVARSKNWRCKFTLTFKAQFGQEAEV